MSFLAKKNFPDVWNINIVLKQIFNKYAQLRNLMSIVWPSIDMWIGLGLGLHVDNFGT